jgi:hypothetical protein
MSGDEGQERGRYELHQTDHAEREYAASQRIDLPPDCDRADLK